MKKRLFILFFVLGLIGNTLQAQILDEDQSFETELIRIYISLFSSASDESFRKADSLYQVAESPRQKAGALLLSANLLGKEGRHLEAIRYSDRALALAREVEDYGTEVMAHQNRVRFYANHGFFDQAEAALDKGWHQVERITDKKRYTFCKGNLLKASGQLSMIKGESAKADQDFRAAIRSLKSLGTWFDLSNTVIFDIYNLLGHLYFESGHPKKALEAYYEGQRYMSDTHGLHTLYAGYIYNGLAAVYLDQQELDSTLYYLNRATAIATSARINNLRFKQSTYGQWLEYYRRTHQQDRAAYYREQYAAIKQHREIKNREVVNTMMEYILQDVSSNNIMQDPQQTRGWWLFGGVLLIGFSGFYLYRRYKIKFSFLMKQVEEAVEHQKTIRPAQQKEIQEPAERLSISVTEGLKQQLKKFEAEKKFLDSQMSFPKMAGALNTNTKYLSTFLASSLDTNYLTYINQKRIEFVVHKLQTDMKWQTYKLTYLARKAGFSSYSAFANNFKRYTNMSPSAYITNLNSRGEKRKGISA